MLGNIIEKINKIRFLARFLDKKTVKHQNLIIHQVVLKMDNLIHEWSFFDSQCGITVWMIIFPSLTNSGNLLELHFYQICAIADFPIQTLSSVYAESCNRAFFHL